MKLILPFKSPLFFLFFFLLTGSPVFSQSPPHIIASANITTVTFCKNQPVSINVTYSFYNSGETTATAPSRHNSGSGALNLAAGDFSSGSLYEILPGQTLNYHRSFSFDPDSYQGESLPDTDYTETFFMTCAEPGATYETASIHLQSLSFMPAQATTQNATNVNATSATLNGTVVSVGQCPQQGGTKFIIATDPNYENIVGIFTQPQNSTGPFSYNIQNLSPETTYYYVARMTSNTSNPYPASTFTTPAAAANDTCSNAAPLSISAPSVQGSLANSVDGDVFYSFTPAVTGTHYITINNFGMPGNINLFVSDGCGGSVVGSGTSASLNTETASMSLVAGTTYYIRVVDADLRRSTFDIRVDPPYPLLSTNGTSNLQFADYFNDTFSASKSFTLSGIDLTGAPGVISISSTDPSFELSLDNSNWSNGVNLNYTGINLSNTLVYVRMPAQSLGTKTGTITFSGGGVVTAPIISLSGNAVLRPPTVYTNGTSTLNFGTVDFPLASVSQSFNLSGIRLVGFPSSVAVSVSGTDFQVSSDNNSWGTTVSVPYTTETLGATAIYVRFNAQAVGVKSGSLTFTAPGLSGAPTISLSGTSAITIPNGLTAVPANTTFTANWNAVPGAASYLLDVDGNAGFNSAATVVNVATWNLTSNKNISSGITSNTSTNNPLSTVGSNAVGSFNTNGAFTAGWTAGAGIKYWQVSFSTQGYTQIKVSSIQRGTVTSPRDFKLQYSIANGSWTDVPGGAVTSANNNTSGVLTNVALPVQCNNKANVSLRWIMTSDTAVNGGAIVNTAASFIKGITINGQNIDYVAFRNYVVNGTSQSVTGLIPGKTYYYRVRAQAGSFISGNSVTENTTTGSTTVWNGSQWSPEAPDENIDAAVTGAYNTGTNGAFSTHDLTINSGGSVVVAAGTNVSVTGNLYNTQAATAFTVENNANLIQSGISNGNTGAITVKRSASMNRLDYTYWSAPVANQNLLSFSPLTLANRFYEAVESNDSFTAPQSSTFVAAKGYCIRAPNNFAASPALPQTFEGSFTGVPNNGSITIPMTKIGQGFNLIGNPYPSTISTSAFFASNPSVGTLYFWTHKVQGTNGDNAANYTSVNRTGATVAPGTTAPNGTIQTGQGFMAQTNAATDAVFLSSMRVANNLGQFYRTSSDGGEVSGGGKIWLNIADTNKTIGQVLTGYVDGATNGFDFAYDGKAIESTGTQLYNVVDQEAYIIQGRALPFDATDSVALGFKTETAGTYTISIDHLDGLFSDVQDVFLKDELAGTITDIKAGPYSFASETGTFNNRFRLVYQNSVLGVDTPDVAENGVVVYKTDGAIVIDSGANAMQQVKVYNMRGQLLFEDNEVNDTTTTIKNPGIYHQVVIMKIQTSRGTVSKKVVL